MGGAVFMLGSIALAVFGIAYLFFSTRNRERLALIEKGADASIFGHSQKAPTAPIWKILTLNLALLLMGIGLGIIIGAAFRNGPLGDVAMPGSIFFMAGTGLLAGFFLTKKMDKTES